MHTMDGRAFEFRLCEICENLAMMWDGEQMEQCGHCLRSCCYNCLRVGGGFELLCDKCFEGCTADEN